MMVEKKVLTERIRELCERKHFSYYNLAAKSSVPLTTVMNIVNGVTRNPGIYTIFKLCDGLDISVKEFFGTDEFGEMPDEKK
ncbi:helix-turn-helix domain-containing protein [Ruminococcus sp. 5_1_39BFAA]|uniref:helix-turn-helix domain-containing protein n=1 Tax=Ruminococcus sp. 5_1_39BFAA TaxID=457412 RepID=UPI00356A2D69